MTQQKRPRRLPAVVALTFLAIAALIACAGVVQAVRQESWEPIWSIGWLPAIVVAMLWTPRSGKSCWTRLRGVARR